MIAALGLESHRTCGRVAQAFVADAIPGGTAHLARVVPAGSYGYGLLGNSEWGRVRPQYMESSDLESLAENFPGAQVLIRPLTAPEHLQRVWIGWGWLDERVGRAALTPGPAVGLPQGTGGG